MRIDISENEVMQDLYDVDGRKQKNEEYHLNRVSSNQSPEQSMNYPDAKKHQIVSFIKSGIRIVGYCFIPISLAASAFLLILSEAVGIYEELV